MGEHGVPIRRVINGGGIPQKNQTLNRVYANVLGKPVLVPESEVTSLGSAIFAFLAAGTFKTVEEAQERLCPKYRVVEPDPHEHEVYEKLFTLYRQAYFALGQPDAPPAALGHVLPELRRIAAAGR
jgi:L-ribulokinase